MIDELKEIPQKSLVSSRFTDFGTDTSRSSTKTTIGDNLMNLKHSIFQTEVQFNAPIKSGHASGMIGNQSNHPQGNPALEDTYIISKNKWSDTGIRVGKAKYQPCPTCNPPIPDWRIDKGSNFSSLDDAKSYIEGLNKYWIDEVSPKTTTTSGRGSSSSSKKSKKTSRKGRSWRSRLRSLRKRFKW